MASTPSGCCGNGPAEGAREPRQHGLPEYQLLQPEYNLYDRAAYEREIGPVALAKQLGVIVYYDLASGFLSGKYRSAADLANKVCGSRVEKYLNEHGLRILGALGRVAEPHGGTPATVALAWRNR